MEHSTKILELTNYSAGICGVYQRVKQESLELSKKGYEVRILTSDFTKGSSELASPKDNIGSIQILRFPAKKIGGEGFLKWDFESAALEFRPDIIIAHSYRIPHTIKALKVANKLKKQGKPCKVFLVTHAPFIIKNSTRSILSSIAVNFYDMFLAKKILNKFDRIINITQWEIPILLGLGVNKEKLVYIPNGIPEDFFKKRIGNGKNVLFLGRIAPVKNLENLIYAVKDLDINLDIVGPAEKGYLQKLRKIIQDKNIKNINFLPPVYNMPEKIKLFDRFEIFVLPSKIESMPQSLIEAMARGKIVISSKTRGGQEIISNGKNGFLFEIGNINELKQIIQKINSMSKNEKANIIKNAIKTSEKFKWDELIRRLESLF